LLRHKRPKREKREGGNPPAKEGKKKHPQKQHNARTHTPPEKEIKPPPHKGEERAATKDKILQGEPEIRLD